MTQLLALYSVLRRQQITRGRLTLVGLLAALSLLVGFAINRGNQGASMETQLENGAALVWFLGIGLIVPIISLVLASSTLGDLVEDETLVYLWHRPAPRWMLAVAAWGASLTVALPATVWPLAISGFVASDFQLRALGASALSVAVATAAYSGLFVLLGLLVKRALLWGLVYVFIWELFVARVGSGAATLSIGTYPSSILSSLLDIDLPLATRSVPTGILVPLIVAAVAIGLTAWRLDNVDVA